MTGSMGRRIRVGFRRCIRSCEAEDAEYRQRIRDARLTRRQYTFTPDGCATNYWIPDIEAFVWQYGVPIEDDG